MVLPLSIFLLSKYVFSNTGNKANVEWYDENGKEFVITTADELYGMIALSDFYDFKDQTIKLGADIVVNEGNAEEWAKKGPSRKWYPITGFAGTFDGQGHSISGIYAKSVDMAMGLFSDTQRDCVIKDFKLVNSYFSGASEGVGSVSAYGGGLFDTIYSDAIIETKNPYAGGLVGQMNIAGEHKLSNCWFDGTVRMTTEEAVNGGCFIGAIAGDGSIVTMEHCLNTGSISAQGTSRGVDVGGYTGLVTKGSVVYVTDCLNSGTVDTKYTTRVGSLFGNIQSGARTFTSHVYATTECFGATMGYLGGNVKGAPVVYPTELISGYGAYQWTTLDFDTYWAVVKEDTPMLQTFADEVPKLSGIEKCYDDSWYNEFATEFTISTLEEFYGFYILSANDNFEGKTIYMGDDLVVNDGKASEWGEKAPKNIWYPINSFAGTFDGQGHTISGVYVKGQNQKQGLFAETTTAAMITNLRITNSYFESTSTGMAIIGSAVGRGNGIIDTVYSDAIIVCSGTGCGGIVGQVYTGMTNLISNCWFDGTIRMTTEMGKQCGGILGITRADVEIEHCMNTGKITAEDTKALRIGGILGITAGKDFTATIRDCLSAGKITAANSRVGAALSEVGANTKVVMRDVYAATESLTDGKTYLNKAIGVVNADAVADGSAVLLPEKELKGVSAYQWTTLNFDKFWAAKASKTPELISFTSGANMSVAGVKKKMDTSWYDAKATSYTIDSVEDLYGFFIVSALTDFKGKTVKLGANITVNTGNAAEWEKNAPANIWYPINVFAGTFDGQGKTISGIYLKNENQKVGLFGETTVDAVLKNVRITNSYFESTSTGMAILGSLVGRGNGLIDTVYSDAVLVSCGTGNGGIVGQVYTEGKNRITNCWFDGSITLNDKGGRQAGGILGITRTGVTIEHCLNTGTITTKETSALRIGGILGVVVGGTFTANVNDCLNAGNIVSANSRVGSVVAEVSASTTLAMKDVYATTESFSNGKTYVNKTIGHLDPQGKVDGSAIVLTEKVMSGTGGYRWTTLNFKQYWAAKADTIPQLKKFTTGANLNTTGIVQANTSWYDASKTEYEISKLDQLYGLVKLSLSNDFKGKKIKLMNDITVNSGDVSTWGTTPPSDEWVPIGSEATPFAGTFDGRGNKIIGVYLKTIGKYNGLFGMTAEVSRIKNLRLTNSYFEFNGTGDACLGSIAGGNQGTIHTVYSDAIVVSSGNYNGGIVGSMLADNAKVINSWYNGTLSLGTNSGKYAGGIVGIVTNDATVYISHCLNNGKLSAVVKTGDTLGLSGVGGICGYVYTGKIIIEDTLNTGEIDVEGNWQASFIGRLGHGDEDAEHAVAVIENSFYSNDNRTCTRTFTSNGGTCEKEPKGLALTGLKGIGGKFSTTLDFDNYWCAVREQAPQLQSFASGGVLSVWKGEGTQASPWLISNADELALLAEVASGNPFANAYFELTEDITVDSTKNWLPIGNESSRFAGHFNGNNKKISGIHFNGAGKDIGLFGATDESAVIENFRLADSTFEYTKGDDNVSYARIGSVVGYARGTIRNIKVENTVTVKSNYFCNGGIVGTVWGGNTTISNCAFYGNLTLVGAQGRQSGGIIGRIYAGGKTVLVEHCLNSGTITVEASNPQIGGIIGFVQSVGTLTISDSLSAKEINSDAGSCGAIIGQNSAGITAVMNGVYGIKNQKNHALIGSNAGTIAGAAKEVVTLNDVKGDKAYMRMALDFTDYWVAVADKVPEHKLGNTVQPLPNPYFNGLGTKKTPFLLQTGADLQKVATYAATYDFAGKYFKLAQNVTVVAGDTVDAVKTNATQNWTPIGSASKPFAGTFDGNGKTISGIYYNGTGANIGLFGQTAETATIKNFELVNSYFKTTSTTANVCIGSVAGRAYGTFLCIKSQATVSLATNCGGGIAGAVWNAGTATFDDCWFAGTLDMGSGTSKAGGIVGTTYNKAGTIVRLTNCLNTGTFIGGSFGVGGMCGCSWASTDVILTNCVNAGKIPTGTAYGAMFGDILASGQTITVNNCYAIESKLDNNANCVTVCYGRLRAGDNKATYVNNGYAIESINDFTNGSAQQLLSALFVADSKGKVHWTDVPGSTPILSYFAK